MQYFILYYSLSAIVQTVCDFFKGKQECCTVALTTQAFRKPREGFFFCCPSFFFLPFVSFPSIRSEVRLKESLPTTTMLLLTLMSLAISLVKADQKRPLDLSETLGEHVALGQLTLNEMFKEVEKLMEDTQQKLEEAVHQVVHRATHFFCSFPTPEVD